MAWEDGFACVMLISAAVCVLSSYLAYCDWSVRRDVDEVKRLLDDMEDEIRRTTGDMIRTVERTRKWPDEG